VDTGASGAQCHHSCFFCKIEKRSENMEIVVAAVRKMRYLVYGILKSGKHLDPSFFDHQVILS
jgi:hypothetical protein